MTDINALAQEIHEIARSKGFWDKERNMGEMLMLATSELAEALEEHRSNKPAIYHEHSQACEVYFHDNFDVAGEPPECTCSPKPEGIAVELADCIIRCLDTMQSLGVDIDAVIKEKMAYNAGRPFMHGRQY